MNKNILGMVLIILLLIGAGVGWLIWRETANQKPPVTNFEDCVAAGYPIAESYPEQCISPAGTFTREIGNELASNDLIQLDSPRPEQVIASPLVVTGRARGTWYFEATFPLVLTDWDGRIIAEGYAEAEGDWMTEDFVPFRGTLEFETPLDIGDFSRRGSLILQKSNPSGLPEHDDALELTVYYR